MNVTDKWRPNICRKSAQHMKKREHFFGLPQKREHFLLQMRTNSSAASGWLLLSLKMFRLMSEGVRKRRPATTQPTTIPVHRVIGTPQACLVRLFSAKTGLKLSEYSLCSTSDLWSTHKLIENNKNK